MSVVDRTGSSGATRPLLLRRWEAKIVFIRVDLPRPVWPDVEEYVRARKNSGIEQRCYCLR